MEILISIVLAYLLYGISQAAKDISSHPIDRPIWAMRPTTGMIIGAVLTWPVGQFINNAYPFSRRSIAFTVFSIVVAMGVTTVFTWCCITISVHIFDSTILQIITTLILIVVGTPIVLPLLSLLIVPLTLFIAWPLDFLFPLETENNTLNIKNANKVEPAGINRPTDIENELKNKINRS